MQINASRQQILQAYAKARQATYRLLAIPLGIVLGVAIVLLPGRNPPSLLGMLNIAVRRFLQPLSWQPVYGWYPLQIIAYYGITCLALELLYTPIAFHIDYTLPKRFKLATRSPRATLSRILRQQTQLLIRWAFIIEAFYLCFTLQPLLWWVEMALILSVLALLEQERSQTKIRRLFTIQRLPEGDLTQRLRKWLVRFSIAAHEIVVVDKPGVKMEANAYIFYGRKPLVGISSTMLKEFSLDEIEVIFVHELGHHVHHDRWRRFGVRLAVRLIGYGIMCLILVGVTAMPWYAYHSLSDVTTIPLFIVAHLLFWIYGSVTYNTFSRRCESEADEFALQTTGLTTAFKHAMMRMANINRIVAHPTENYSTHPSIASRILYADEFAAKRS